MRDRIFVQIHHGNHPGENPDQNQQKVIKQISFLPHTLLPRGPCPTNYYSSYHTLLLTKNRINLWWTVAMVCELHGEMRFHCYRDWPYPHHHAWPRYLPFCPSFPTDLWLPRPDSTVSLIISGPRLLNIYTFIVLACAVLFALLLFLIGHKYNKLPMFIGQTVSVDCKNHSDCFQCKGMKCYFFKLCLFAYRHNALYKFTPFFTNHFYYNFYLCRFVNKSSLMMMNANIYFLFFYTLCIHSLFTHIF